MRITDLLNTAGIRLHAAPAGKDEAIDLLVSLQDRAAASPTGSGTRPTSWPGRP